MICSWSVGVRSGSTLIEPGGVVGAFCAQTPSANTTVASMVMIIFRWNIAGLPFAERRCLGLAGAILQMSLRSLRGDPCRDVGRTDELLVLPPPIACQ